MAFQARLKLGLSRFLFFVRPTMMFEQIKAQAIATVPFARHVGITISHVERGRAEARLEARPELSNHLGTVHAAALFALGEAASGAAMAGALAPVILSVRPVATEASIRYLKPAKGPISAHGQVLKDSEELVAELTSQGKVRFPLQVKMIDTQAVEVCTMQVEWQARTAR